MIEREATSSRRLCQRLRQVLLSARSSLPETEATEIRLERDAGVYAERARPSHLPDETRGRELTVRKRDRDVARVERVPHPEFGEEIPPARAAAEIRERVGILAGQVHIVILERPVERCFRSAVRG